MRTNTEDEFSRYLRLRWTRGDAERYMRPDADRYMRPDADRYLRPDHERFLLPGFQESKVSASPPEPAGGSHREWLDDAEIRRLRCGLADLKLQLALLRFERQHKALHHSNFQPRVPAGNTDGGQFTDGNGQGRPTQVAVRDPRIIFRILERLLRPSLGQSRAELANQRRVAEALNRVWDLDPNWLPNVEGEHGRAERVAQQAERCLGEFAHLQPETLISSSLLKNSERMRS